MRKPRVLRPGDRIAVVAPASPFAREAFDAGLAELRALGFDPVYDETVFERRGYVAGRPDIRASALLRAWTDPSIAGVIAVRGGYGSAQLLPFLDPDVFAAHPKAFIGYSDTTSLLSWLTLTCGVVAFHGPMLDRRLAHGERGYDRDTFTRCLCRVDPIGAIAHPALQVLHEGDAEGTLVGGTLTQLAASLGTPYAFAPPSRSVLFLEDIGERPYRIDRMITQLQQAGVLDRATALVFGELPGCDEPGGVPAVREVIAEVTAGFQGPVLFGLPSGHTTGPTLTLPFGTHTRVVTRPTPQLFILESAVTE
jgi:muramoyltetrapeptide carboxypeptidase